MSERYLRMHTITERHYTSGAPLVIEAGAILKDNNTGKIVVQLKFCNIQPKLIKMVRVQVLPKDTVNRVLPQSVCYTYMDVNAGRDMTFGSKEAIIMPNPETRGMSIVVTEVGFSDNTVWTGTTEFHPIHKQIKIESIFNQSELVKQYLLNYGEECRYKAEAIEDIWYCTCGSVNSNKEDRCHRCARSLSEFRTIDIETLTEGMNHRLAKEKEEQDRLSREKQKRDAARNKKIKYLAACFSLIAVCVGAFVFNRSYLQPSMSYRSAVTLQNGGEYENAILIYEGIKDFRDSSAKIEECENAILEAVYIDAMEKMEQQRYEEAIQIFESIFEYKDSLDKIRACWFGQTDLEYQAALNLKETGNELEAYTRFINLGDFKDSEQQAKMIFGQYEDYEMAVIQAAAVGDVVFFGHYEQDNDAANGKEPVAWIVLEKAGNKALLLSEKGLINRQFYTHDYSFGVSNAEHVHSWMNDSLMKEIFSREEQSCIQTSSVQIEKFSQKYQGSMTTAAVKLFILSADEVETYFPNAEDRICIATEYARRNGAFIRADTHHCRWWLRTPSRFADCVQLIDFDGAFFEEEYAVRYTTCVRPAMWINVVN